MASAAPARHKSPRHTVQSPADNDHSIAPTAKITPRPMKAQGFASYRVCGVQGRMAQILQRLGGRRPDSFTIRPMTITNSLGRIGLAGPWATELGLAALGLIFGGALMPVLIFFTGAAILGRYEGASLGNLYHSLLAGLEQGSIASWAVLLGPYGLYLLFRGLRACWRLGPT
jgi:hypothetical protein